MDKMMNFRQDKFLLIDENIKMFQDFYDGVCQYNEEYIENIKNEKMCFFDYKYLANKFADNSFAQSFIFYHKDIGKFNKQNEKMKFCKETLKESTIAQNQMDFLMCLIEHYILIENPIKMIMVLDERMNNYLFKFYDIGLPYSQVQEDFELFLPNKNCFLFYDSETKIIINCLIANLAKNKKSITIAGDIYSRKTGEKLKNISMSKTYPANQNNLIFDAVTAINKFVSEYVMDEIFNNE